MVSAIAEIEIVANLGPYPDGAGKSLKAVARSIANRVVRLPSPTELGESGGRGVIGDVETLKPNFPGDKYAERSRPRLEFRTPKTRQGSKWPIPRFGGDTIREGLPRALPEVLRHFRHHLNAGANVD
jgi:hypothetical protein